MEEGGSRKFLIVLTAFILIALSCTPILAATDVAAADATSVVTAESNGNVTVDIVGHAPMGSYESVNLITGSGVFFGECIDITVTSLTSTSLSLELTAGQRLVSNDTEIQDMVVTESYTFTLVPGQIWHQSINAMCINMHEYAPDDSSTYFLGSMTTGDLHGLAVYCDEHDAHGGEAQGAIWAVTDGATVDDLDAYGLTTSSIESANSMYSSVTGESIEGFDDSTTDEGDTSDPIPWWPFLVLIPVVIVVVVILLYFRQRKKRSQAAQGQMGAYYPPNGQTYQPYQSNYPQYNQPNQQGYQQRPPAPIPPSQPPTAPPQPPVQQNANIVGFCPNCGMKTDGRSLNCPRCGGYLGKQ